MSKFKMNCVPKSVELDANSDKREHFSNTENTPRHKIKDNIE